MHFLLFFDILLPLQSICILTVLEDLSAPGCIHSYTCKLHPASWLSAAHLRELPIFLNVGHWFEGVNLWDTAQQESKREKLLIPMGASYQRSTSSQCLVPARGSDSQLLNFSLHFHTYCCPKRMPFTFQHTKICSQKISTFHKQADHELLMSHVLAVTIIYNKEKLQKNYP